MRLKPVKPDPEHMDIRRRVVFAWTPMPCTDGYWHWLEYVEITEKYRGVGVYEWFPIAIRTVFRSPEPDSPQSGGRE